jgi:quercetin dioxygenase-like cupin family protein
MGVIHRRTGDGPDWRWDGVEVEGYTHTAATKQVLIGKKEGANNFAIRYFTIPPRSFSNLDHHGHDHGVMIMNGRARVMLGEQFEEVQAGDVIYIESWERHQFENLTDEPMTFLCIVPPRLPHPTTEMGPALVSETENSEAK